MPTIEELKEFVKKIPKTPEGKLEAMNKIFLKEENMEEAFKTMLEFTRDFMRNNPEYFKALKDCKTEQEIKEKSKEFIENNPKMIEEVGLSLIAAKRNKDEDKE